MSNIREMLERRQKALETKEELLKTAKRLQMSADALIKQANEVPVISEVKLNKAERADRKEQFQSNVRNGLIKEMDADLKRFEWKFISYQNDNPLHRTYFNPKYPGFYASYTPKGLTVTFNGKTLTKDAFSKHPESKRLIDPSPYCKIGI